MAWHAQRIYPVPYQWRRAATALAAAAALTVAGKALDVPLVAALVLAAVYPFTLVPLGFYLAEERRLVSSRLLRGRPRAHAP
jgi:hypothetical protein